MKSVHLSCLLLVVGSPLAAGAGTSLTAETISNTDWVVQWQGQQLCVYHFGPDFKKPYVREIHTLTGHNILRDSPSDHLHHHALMYGVVVNGVNFWEETTDYGLQKSVKLLEERVGSDDHGRPQASFRHRLAWVAAKPDARPLLYEDRSLTLSIDEAGQEVALIWQSRFEVAPDVDRVILSGANYHGLGMRFLQELDPLAVHWVDSERLDLSDNRQDVRPSTWGAVEFEKPDRPATVVLAGSPQNRGAPAYFFSMRTPFAYLSATQNLDQAPLEYTTGQSWTLTHLLLLYPEMKSPSAIESRVARWSQAQASRP